MGRRFVCFYHYNGLWYWQLGFHVYLPAPNIEIHVPFGFIRIGWESNYLLDDVKRIKDIGYSKGSWQVRKYTTEVYD